MPDGRVKQVHTVGKPLVNQAGRSGVRWVRRGRHRAKRALREMSRNSRTTLQENIALKEEIDQASNVREMSGASEPLRRVLAHVAKVAPTDSTVLITGGDRNGQRAGARASHSDRYRSGRAFIRVNCARRFRSP